VHEHPTASGTRTATEEARSAPGMHPTVRASSLYLRAGHDGTFTLTFNGTTVKGLSDVAARVYLDSIHETGQLPQPTGELFDPEVLRDALEGRR
jgi:hypothetical protein